VEWQLEKLQRKRRVHLKNLLKRALLLNLAGLALAHRSVRRWVSVWVRGVISMKDQVIQLLWEVLPMVIAVVAPYIGYLLRELVIKVFDLIEAQTTNKWIKKSLVFAENAVLSVEQQLLDKARDLSKDGKFDKDDWAKLCAEAKSLAIGKYKGALKSAPLKAKDLLEDQADDMIEAALKKLKLSKAIPSGGNIENP